MSDLLHPNGRCECYGEGRCDWCLRTEAAMEREVIVCGSRVGNPGEGDAEWLEGMLRELRATAVVHGDCPGGHPFHEPGYDRWAGTIALAMGLREVKCPYARGRGKQGGPIRNSAMAKRPNVVACLAFPGGDGTKDMVTKAQRKGIPVYFRKPVPPKWLIKPRVTNGPAKCTPIANEQQELIGFICESPPERKP